MRHPDTSEVARAAMSSRRIKSLAMYLRAAQDH
jgi:hypothetical protein